MTFITILAAVALLLTAFSIASRSVLLSKRSRGWPTGQWWRRVAFDLGALFIAGYGVVLLVGSEAVTFGQCVTFWVFCLIDLTQLISSIFKRLPRVAAAK